MSLPLDWLAAEGGGMSGLDWCWTFWQIQVARRILLGPFLDSDSVMLSLGCFNKMSILMKLFVFISYNLKTIFFPIFPLYSHIFPDLLVYICLWDKVNVWTCFTHQECIVALVMQFILIVYSAWCIYIYSFEV